MFSTFDHYLSYGATDQQTSRELTGDYNGLLVPGTVAAFQSEGTKGFVLTLSSFKHVPYAIDPRFPLFQNRLPQPKKSHEALAAILGVPELVNEHSNPMPEHFTAAWISTIAEAWLDFNGGYTTVSSQHFKKYAARLGEEVLPASSSSPGPAYILPPYTVAHGPADPWWTVSERLWSEHVRLATARSQEGRLVRVVAADHADQLASLLGVVPDSRAAVWANALDELDVSPGGRAALLSYRRAIQGASDRGMALFALYGGFFAVLMSAFGLRGASHGIGFGEARTWVELPQSGPPPARYYLPKAHRYVSQDLAEYFWFNARDLVECDCPECGSGNPGLLDYHDLMKHSVRCRAREVQQWVGLSAADAASELRNEDQEFRSQLARLYVPQALARQAQNCFRHLEGWADVLDTP